VGAVEVLEVSLSEAQAERFAGRSIDKPAPGMTAGGAYELDVRGWAIGVEAEVVAVDFVDREILLRRAPAGVGRSDVAAAHPELPGARSSGFYATIGTLELPVEFELRLEAVFANDSRATIGTVKGRRRTLATSFEPRLQPLMLTSPGRTGSTILMQMLSAHPEVVVYPPFEHEPRVATYWIDLLKTLANPASYLRQIAPAGNLSGAWWLGEREPVPRRLSRPDIQEWLGGEAVEEVAALCQSRIEALYERLIEPSTTPKYFAEKFRADNVPALMWELYPQAREVILVRDLRDVVCSIFATTEKRGVQQLQPDRGRYIAEQLKGRVEASVDALTARRERAHLVRYEDLMLRPEETLTGLLSYLGVDSSDRALAAMLEHAAKRLPSMDKHRTTPDPVASIGRWKRDLSPELQRVCEEALGPALEAFGYAS
jgi:hypothetical protein